MLTELLASWEMLSMDRLFRNMNVFMSVLFVSLASIWGSATGKNTHASPGLVAMSEFSCMRLAQ